MKSLLDLQEELEFITAKQENIFLSAAESKHLFDTLDKNKDDVLAEIKVKLEGSDAAKTTQALADPKYKEYKKTLAEMRRVYYRDKANEGILVRRIDALRTLISSLSRERL
jgi:hypothetical protein